jgi:hypothetical protein
MADLSRLDVEILDDALDLECRQIREKLKAGHHALNEQELAMAISALELWIFHTYKQRCFQVERPVLYLKSRLKDKLESSRA